MELSFRFRQTDRLLTRPKPRLSRTLTAASISVAAAFILLLFLSIFDIQALLLHDKLGLYVKAPTLWFPGAPHPLQVVVVDPATSTPLRSQVEVRLSPRGSKGNWITIFSGETGEDGLLALDTEPMGNLDPGNYSLDVSASSQGRSDQASIPVQVVSSSFNRILLTVDKKWFQPGQTIHSRVLVWKGATKYAPAKSVSVDVSLVEPKGTKIFKKTLTTDEYGIASCDIPLAGELAYGRYRLQASLGNQSQEVVLNIQEYKLPTMRIDLRTDREWYMPGDTVSGALNVSYFFGRPVSRANVEIEVLGYVGEMKEFWRYSSHTDEEGRMRFEAKIPDYLVGRPEYGYQSKVTLNITVKDSADHVERTSKDLIVVNQPFLVKIFTAKDHYAPGSTIPLVISAMLPDGTPAGQATVSVRACESPYPYSEGRTFFEKTYTANEAGVVTTALQAPSSNYTAIYVSVVGREGYTSQGQLLLYREYFQGDYSITLLPDKISVNAGDRVTGTIYVKKPLARAGSDWVYLDVVNPVDKVTLYATAIKAQNGQARFDLTSMDTFTPHIMIRSYIITPAGDIVADWAKIQVAPPQGLRITIVNDQEEYLPGDNATLTIIVEDKDGKPVTAMLGISVIDSSVRYLSEEKPGFEKTFYALEQEYQTPMWEIHGLPPSVPYMEWENREASAASNNIVEARVAKTNIMQGARFTLALSLYAAPPAALMSGAILYGKKREKSRRWAKALLALGAAGFYLEGAALFAVGVPQLILATPEPPQMSALRYVTPQPENLRGPEPPSFFNGALQPMIEKMFTATMTQAVVEELAADRGAGIPAPLAQQIETMQVRWYFPETLYWSPETLAENGQATIPLPLAHTITTWSTKVIASTQSGEIGVGYGDILVFKEFFVEPDIPLKVTQDDEITLRTAVYNYVDHELQVKMVLKNEPWLKNMDEALKEITVPGNSVTKAEWRIKVLEAGTHDVTIYATAGDRTDAVRKEVKVLPNGVPIEAVYNGEGDRKEDYRITLYPEAIPGSEKAYIRITPGYVGPLLTGLEAMLGYPWGCVEQTSSRLIPDALVWRYMELKGKLTPELRAKLDSYLQVGIQRLLYLQHSDGSFGWWVDDEPNVAMSSWVLNTWSEIQKAGFYLDPSAVSRLQNYILSRQNSDGSWTPEGWFGHGQYKPTHLVMTSYALRSLLKSGIPADDARVSKAASYLVQKLKSEELKDPYGVALAVITLRLAETPVGDQTLQLALTWLEKTAQTDSEGGVHWTGGSSFSGDAETTGYVAMALITSNRSPDLVNAAVSWMLKQRGGWGGLETTSDTCILIEVLTIMAEKQAEDANLEVTVNVNGKPVYSDTVTAESYDLVRFFDLLPHLKQGPNTVGVTASGKGVVFYQIVAKQTLRSELTLHVEADKLRVKQGEIVRIKATATPPESNITPALVKISAQGYEGFEPVGGNTRAINLLTEEEAVDLYFRALKPGDFVLGPFAAEYGLLYNESIGGIITTLGSALQIHVEPSQTKPVEVEVKKTIETETGRYIAALGTPIHVLITVTSKGEDLGDILVEDYLPAGFVIQHPTLRPLNNTPSYVADGNKIVFHVDQIKKGETTHLEYTMIAMVTGEHIVPGAVATRKGEVIGASEISQLAVVERGLAVTRTLDTTDLRVGDTARVDVTVFYAGGFDRISWIIVDIPIPPGFELIPESLEKALKQNPRLVRYDVPEPRRAAFFIDQMNPGDTVTFNFSIRATHPVKAAVQPVEASSMYTTDARAQSTQQIVHVQQ